MVQTKSFEYFGQGVGGNSLNMFFLCNQFALKNNKLNLVEGAFLVAIPTKIEFFTHGKPERSALNLKRKILIRLRGETDFYSNDICRIIEKRKEQISSKNEHEKYVESYFYNMFCGQVIGSFIEDDNHEFRFSADSGNIYPAMFYHLYIPDVEFLNIITNGTLVQKDRIDFGRLRLSEDLTYKDLDIPVEISMLDIRGKRTAMFGKTRMGKSNAVKLLVQGLLDVTVKSKNVGQLIFDVNGEYANANPQDGAVAIAEAYKDRCLTYFLMQRGGNPNAKLLRFNFYERTEEAFGVMKELLPPEISSNSKVSQLLSCVMPKFKRMEDDGDKYFNKNLRKIMLYWAILFTAGFEADVERLKEKLDQMNVSKSFNPNFSHGLRMAAYQAINNSPPPPPPVSFFDMVREFQIMAGFSQEYENDPGLNKNGEYIFDLEEEIMISFLQLGAVQGPYLLRPCLQYHSPTTEDFIFEILNSLAEGNAIIVDLGSANEQVIRYFAKSLSSAVFQEQERRFVSNQLHGKYVQIYFEEAHMIFPPNSGNVIDVYSRFAKEGAKFHIGIVYSTQSPSTINRDLLAQTENFFIGHLSSEYETEYLSSLQIAFKGMEPMLMRFRTPGLLHLLTNSHRYLLPVQVNRYDGTSRMVL